MGIPVSKREEQLQKISQQIQKLYKESLIEKNGKDEKLSNLKGEMLQKQSSFKNQIFSQQEVRESVQYQNNFSNPFIEEIENFKKYNSLYGMIYIFSAGRTTVFDLQASEIKKKDYFLAVRENGDILRIDYRICTFQYCEGQIKFNKNVLLIDSIGSGKGERIDSNDLMEQSAKIWNNLDMVGTFITDDQQNLKWLFSDSLVQQFQQIYQYSALNPIQIEILDTEYENLNLMLYFQGKINFCSKFRGSQIKVVNIEVQTQYELSTHSQKSGPNSKWTNEQLQTFMRLYLRYGSKWKFFVPELKNKCYKQIKNKFGNSFKKISKILYDQEGFICKNTQRTISPQMLRTLTDFIQQLQTSICQLGLTPNYESKLFRFREQFFRISLLSQPSEIQKTQINNLIKIIKSLNSKIKNYRIYRKGAQRKTKGINKSSILSILQFDNIIKEDITQIMLRLKVFKNEDKSEKASELAFISGDLDLNLRDISLIEVESISEIYIHRQQYSLEMQYCQIVGQMFVEQEFFEF